MFHQFLVVLWGASDEVRLTWGEVLFGSITSLIVWSILYILFVKVLCTLQGSQISYPSICECSNRFMSIIHAISSTTAFYRVHSVTNSVVKFVPFYDNFVYITLGYEFYDLLCLLHLDRLYKEEERKNPNSKNNNRIGIAIFIHHFFCVLSCLLYIRVGKNGICPMGSLSISGMFFMEFSSLFMHVRWTLLLNKMGGSLIFHLNTFFLFISFVCTRILIWPYLFYLFAIERNINFVDAPFSLPIECQLGVLFLIFINFYWLLTLGNAAFFKKRAPKPLNGESSEKQKNM